LPVPPGFTISTKVNNRKPEYVCLKFINFV